MQQSMDAAPSGNIVHYGVMLSIKRQADDCLTFDGLPNEVQSMLKEISRLAESLASGRSHQSVRLPDLSGEKHGDN